MTAHPRPGAPYPRRGSGPRRGATPGLVRVSLPPTGGAPRGGYRASARIPSAVLRRVFFDADHAGPSGAREAARLWRAEQLERAAVPDPPLRRVVLKPKSSSGIVGVYRRPPGRGSAAWVASYETAAGERRSRSFSVGRHGAAEARALAVEQRRTWELDDLGRPIPSAPDNLPTSADGGVST